ncbi:MAG TPA: protein-L-isoaspartate(D-aspartate) O-methyltransferase [Bacteroidales bacterium]|nr:protein-L-isoaspartate(D-aspartate) O-methyltransferase [Bacteroidales bacterium]
MESPQDKTINRDATFNKLKSLRIKFLTIPFSTFTILIFFNTAVIGQDFTVQRQKMVKDQIEARGINNPDVLRAMLRVEREKFVPAKLKNDAYGDYPLPIGEGQTISQPYIVALMTQLLGPSKDKKILEIGTGSGYQAAVLSEIFGEVYTIEIIPSLAEKAKKRFKELGYLNIYTKTGDGYQGWAEHAPYDGIIVTCASSDIPQPLKDQLKVGGKMVIPVGSGYAQQLEVVTKNKGRYVKRNIVPVMFVPMKNEKGEKY